jgi:hypothetical protein
MTQLQAFTYFGAAQPSSFEYGSAFPSRTMRMRFSPWLPFVSSTITTKSIADINGIAEVFIHPTLNRWRIDIHRFMEPIDRSRIPPSGRLSQWGQFSRLQAELALQAVLCLFGETFGLWAQRDAPCDGIQVGIQGAAFAQFNMSVSTFDLVNTDYIGGIPITWRRGPSRHEYGCFIKAVISAISSSYTTRVCNGLT